MNHEQGTYVSLELSQACRQQIDKFSSEILGLKNPINPDYLHTTIIYSRASVPTAEYLARSVDIVAKAVRYEIFATHDHRPCLTVLIESKQVRELNSMLVKLGATSKYSTYTPHLTLSYDFDGKIDRLSLIPFELQYDTLVVKPLDVDFIPPTK